MEYLKRNTGNLETFVKAHPRPLGVDEEKRRDLLKLAEFIPQDRRAFYANLRVKE